MAAGVLGRVAPAVITPYLELRWRKLIECPTGLLVEPIKLEPDILADARHLNEAAWRSLSREASEVCRTPASQACITNLLFSSAQVYQVDGARKKH